MPVKELKIQNFDKGLPHVPKNIGRACAILFEMIGCHWCSQELEVFRKLDKEIGFMPLYTFTVNASPENGAHWNKIKKSIKNGEDIQGFPVVMLYAPSGKVVVYTGFEEYEDMKQKMKDFIENN